MKTWQKATGKGQRPGTFTGRSNRPGMGRSPRRGWSLYMPGHAARAIDRIDCERWFSRPSQSPDTMNAVQLPSEMLNPKGCLGQYL